MNNWRWSELQNPTTKRMHPRGCGILESTWVICNVRVWGRFFMPESHFSSFPPRILNRKRILRRNQQLSGEQNTVLFITVTMPKSRIIQTSWVKLNWNTWLRRRKWSHPPPPRAELCSYLFKHTLQGWEIWQNSIICLVSTWKGLADLSQQIQSIPNQERGWRKCMYFPCRRRKLELRPSIKICWNLLWRYHKSHTSNSLQEYLYINDCFTEKFHSEKR